VAKPTLINTLLLLFIRLENLRYAVFVEFGSGTCNDAKFLIQKVGLNPANLFLIEPDIYYLVDGMNKIEGCDECQFFQMGECPDDMIGCGRLPNICSEDILDSSFPEGFADFVYANNVLHCLGFRSMKERSAVDCYNITIKLGLPVREKWARAVSRIPQTKIKQAIAEAYRLLRLGGVFFGRTLSDYLDVDCLRELQDKSEKSEKEEFVIRTAMALQNGTLTGVLPLDFESWAKEVGFRKVYTEVKQENWKPVRDFYFRCEK
jgi:hypothetical protein